MILSVPLILVAVGFLIAVSLTRKLRYRGRVNPHAGWWKVLATRLLGLGAGIAAARWVHDATSLGRGEMLTPSLIGLGLVVGVGVGEAVFRPSPSPALRTAELRRRRVRDYLSAGLTWSVAAMTSFYILTLLFTTATASPDDQGRPGRSFTRADTWFSESRGPYPGSYYSLWLALILILIAVAAATAVLMVVRRARGFGADEHSDEELRKQSVSTVVASFGLAVSTSHAGVAYFAAFGLHGFENPASWQYPAAVILGLSVPVAVCLTLWYLAIIFNASTIRLGPVDTQALR